MLIDSLVDIDPRGVQDHTSTEVGDLGVVELWTQAADGEKRMTNERGQFARERNC
jgi:hypothetical protein